MSEVHWTANNHSDGSGGTGAETVRDFSGAAMWRKSSYSNGDGGHCVEVADNVPGLVPVRDSKLPDTGPVLLLTAHAWAPFVTSLKATAVS
ncbi:MULTISPECIES: DUF397 domain-containing protein [Streptomyces]|uniref:DUF397 domain-containing protein n=1 Tax=Streptomyces TaxID=1883 RepID=UPI0029BFE886|nr:MULTISPECIES: DUF397 domain-containing protein [Streptomyces]